MQKLRKGFTSAKARVHFLRLLCLVILCPADVKNGFDFDSPQPLGEYVFDSWHDADGLPQNSINAIVQTSDGYIWLATFEGLVRYDGVHFTTFDTLTTPGFTHNNVTALCESPAGVLWIGTQGGGLMRLQNDKFTSY